MFDTEVGGQISWLLPAALILLVAGLVLAGRAARTDRRRAGLLLWGGWLLVTGLIFSFMSGIFHAYYTVALAPAVGALVGIGTACCGGNARRPGRQPGAADRSTSRGSGAGRRPVRPVGTGVAAPPPWPAPSRSPCGGRGGCSAAAPTGTRGCAPPCWSSAWPRPS